MRVFCCCRWARLFWDALVFEKHNVCYGQIKKPHSQALYIPGRRASGRIQWARAISIFGGSKITFCQSTVQTAAPPARTNGHSSSSTGHSCPQVSETETSSYTSLHRGGGLARSSLSLTLFPAIVSKTRESFEKTLLGKLVVLKISDSVVARGVTLTRLKKAQKVQAYLIFGFSENNPPPTPHQKKQRSAGVWQDVGEGTCWDKVPVSGPQTHFSADHVSAFIFNSRATNDVRVFSHIRWTQLARLGRRHSSQCGGADRDRTWDRAFSNGSFQNQ